MFKQKTSVQNQLRHCYSALQSFLKIGRYADWVERSQYPVWMFKRRFAKEFLRSLGIEVKVTGNPGWAQPKTPFLIVSNHVSYVDIILMMWLFPHASFVAKAEVQKWPWIGKGARLAHSVFVKRSNLHSRRDARDAIYNAIQKDHRQIMMFPSGTTSIRPLQSWKKGAFDIAAATNTPLIAVRLTYSPLRPVAYIDDDVLYFHLMNLYEQRNIVAHVEILEPQLIQDPAKDCERVRNWAEGILS